MIKIIIIYHSRTDNTKQMAEAVAKGCRDEKAEVTIKNVKDAELQDLLDADGIILGSPTYYGHSAGEIRSFIDSSVALHGKLAGKIGGAFTSSHNIGGGNETAICDMLHSMLVHGMIIQGALNGDHYGPVAIGAPDRHATNNCVKLGRRVVKLANAIAS
jgi:NAD(P)H dehydrogenase (quinone)